MPLRVVLKGMHIGHQIQKHRGGDDALNLPEVD